MREPHGREGFAHHGGAAVDVHAEVDRLERRHGVAAAEPVPAVDVAHGHIQPKDRISYDVPERVEAVGPVRIVWTQSRVRRLRIRLGVQIRRLVVEGCAAPVEARPPDEAAAEVTEELLARFGIVRDRHRRNEPERLHVGSIRLVPVEADGIEVGALQVHPNVQVLVGRRPDDRAHPLRRLAQAEGRQFRRVEAGERLPRSPTLASDRRGHDHHGRYHHADDRQVHANGDHDHDGLRGGSDPWPHLPCRRGSDAQKWGRRFEDLFGAAVVAAQRRGRRRRSREKRATVRASEIDHPGRPRRISRPDYAITL